MARLCRNEGPLLAERSRPFPSRGGSEAQGRTRHDVIESEMRLVWRFYGRCARRVERYSGAEPSEAPDARWRWRCGDMTDRCIGIRIVRGWVRVGCAWRYTFCDYPTLNAMTRSIFKKHATTVHPSLLLPPRQIAPPSSCRRASRRARVHTRAGSRRPIAPGRGPCAPARRGR